MPPGIEVALHIDGTTGMHAAVTATYCRTTDSTPTHVCGVYDQSCIPYSSIGVKRLDQNNYVELHD